MAIETWLPALLGYLIPVGLFLLAWGGVPPEKAAREPRCRLPHAAGLSATRQAEFGGVCEHLAHLQEGQEGRVREGSEKGPRRARDGPEIGPRSGPRGAEMAPRWPKFVPGRPFKSGSKNTAVL